MQALIARVRTLDPRIADWALAVGFMVGCGIEAAVFADGDAVRLAVAAVNVAGLSSLALRRRRPLVPAVVLPATDLLAAAAAPFILTRLTAPYLALMVLLYSLGRYQRGVAAPAAVWLSILLASIIEGGVDVISQLFWLGLLAVGPFAVGRAMRNRTRLQAELRERTRRLERDRALRAERAVEDERARLATELQAVIANGVSAMVVQAEVVPRLIAAGDGARAEAALAEIETTGRESLAEMRRLLGVLRRDEDRPALAPQPTLAEVERLADRVHGEGMVVELSFKGERIELPPGPDLAAYRVVQEALEAAADGGAARATVVIGYEADELRLDVRDDRADATIDPEPLMVMRERLGLYGGRVRAGADDRGAGFRVLARLPLIGVVA